MSILHGVIHGKTIELEREPGFPEGQPVTVEIRPVLAKNPPPAPAAAEPPPPRWLARLAVDPAVRPGKLLVKGTRLEADALVRSLQEGRSDEELLAAYPGLARDDLAAVREYAKLPPEMRRAFGAWAEEAEELDKYLEWSRRQRKVGTRRVED
jgi:uncharacterized protein (DUF433 family)